MPWKIIFMVYSQRILNRFVGHPSLLLLCKWQNLACLCKEYMCGHCAWKVYAFRSTKDFEGTECQWLQQSKNVRQNGTKKFCDKDCLTLNSVFWTINQASFQTSLLSSIRLPYDCNMGFRGSCTDSATILVTCVLGTDVVSSRGLENPGI